MKQIKIANYSIYSDGEYGRDSMGFRSLYKGIRVNVSNNYSDVKHMWFSIITKKDSITKTYKEEITTLVFDDATLSITCNFENIPINHSIHTLTFKEKEYKELKENIPVFMKENGCEFKTITSDSGLELIF